jgi:hypothetical protein
MRTPTLKTGDRWSASTFADRSDYVKQHSGGKACYDVLGDASPVCKTGEVYVSVPVKSTHNLDDEDLIDQIESERTTVTVKGFTVGGNRENSFSFGGHNAKRPATVIDDNPGLGVTYFRSH